MQLHNFDAQKGYLTFAQNTADVDYLRLAYLQALSIKTTQNINKYCVVVDEPTFALITNKHREVFDYVRCLDEDDAADDEIKFANEWKAGIMTPFKETVKLDSDILFTRNVDHWWHIMQMKDVCCTMQVRDYEGCEAESRAYRKVFDDNNLPNVYSGFTYFRYTKQSETFFAIVKDIMEHWSVFRDQILKNCRHEYPQTDEVYAIAVKLLGEEHFYLPIMVPTFTHMKGAIQGWGKNENWMKRLYTQHEGTELMVGFTRQKYPFHYVQKDFATEEMITHYERILAGS